MLFFLEQGDYPTALQQSFLSIDEDMLKGNILVIGI